MCDTPHMCLHDGDHFPPRARGTHSTKPDETPSLNHQICCEVAVKRGSLSPTPPRREPRAERNAIMRNENQN